MGSSRRTSWSNSISPILRTYDSLDTRHKARKKKSTERYAKQGYPYCPVLRDCLVYLYSTAREKRRTKRYTKQRLVLLPTTVGRGGGWGRLLCYLGSEYLRGRSWRKSAKKINGVGTKNKTTARRPSIALLSIIQIIQNHTKPLPRFPFVLTLPREPPSHSGFTVSTITCTHKKNAVMLS